jgi:hypothetical protein
VRRLLAAIAILLVPVQAASADAVRDAPTPGVATCLRATGAPGELTALGPLTRTTSSIDVLGAAGDAITPIANNPFGVLDQCPVTASGGGTTVVAGVVRTGPKTRAMRASVRSGAGALAGPVTLAEFPKVLGEDDFAVGVGPHGDAAVAWVERRNRTAEFVETRVLVARRPAGGSFGPAVVVQDWQKVADTYDTAQIAAGVDAAGTATVAWMRGRDFENIDVLVAAVAPAGPAATPVRLGTSYEGDARVALAVAGNGRSGRSRRSVAGLRSWRRKRPSRASTPATRRRPSATTAQRWSPGTPAPGRQTSERSVARLAARGRRPRSSDPSASTPASAMKPRSSSPTARDHLDRPTTIRSCTRS